MGGKNRPRRSSTDVLPQLLLGYIITVLPFIPASASRTPPDLLYSGATAFGREAHDDAVSSSRHLSSLSRSLVYSSSNSCDGTYGFLPCTSTLVGNLFLILVYGYLMYVAAAYLSRGSELLVQILGPGILGRLFGGLFLPVLGALPDAVFVLVFGLSGSKNTAQEQVSVGMNLLAGSTVMLLTLVWGSCLLLGKCDLLDSMAVDQTNTKWLDLTGSGVSTDIWTSYAARMMLISVLPFIVLQMPQGLIATLLGAHSPGFTGLLLSLAVLLCYYAYQILLPWIRRRRINVVKRKEMISGYLKHIKKFVLGKQLVDDNGRLNEDIVRKLFRVMDIEDDSYLSASDLSAFTVGMRLDGKDYNDEDIIKMIMSDFNPHLKDKISFEEFKDGMGRWISEMGAAWYLRKTPNPDSFLKYLSSVHEREYAMLGSKGKDEKEEHLSPVDHESQKKTALRAVWMFVSGSMMAAVFADPLVDSIDNLGDATRIPSVFISFIILPLATNSREFGSAIICSRQKTRRTSSRIFTELYRTATMKNVFSLSVLLVLVYIRGLTWNFSSEVRTMLVVCMVMGTLGSFTTVLPLWTSFVAFALYFLSLLLVYYVFGWSHR